MVRLAARGRVHICHCFSRGALPIRQICASRERLGCFGRLSAQKWAFWEAASRRTGGRGNRRKREDGLWWCGNGRCGWCQSALSGRGSASGDAPTEPPTHTPNLNVLIPTLPMAPNLSRALPQCVPDPWSQLRARVCLHSPILSNVIPSPSALHACAERMHRADPGTACCSIEFCPCDFPPSSWLALAARCRLGKRHTPCSLLFCAV
jgi:hypothetical protein